METVEEITLGAAVTDTVTGVTGIVTAIAEYLYGERQCHVSLTLPRSLADRKGLLPLVDPAAQIPLL